MPSLEAHCPCTHLAGKWPAASVYKNFFGSARRCLMHFTQHHSCASFSGIDQGYLACTASTLPVLVSLSLFHCDWLDAEDNVHAHILLMGCFCMQGAAQGEIQLLGWHMQQLRHQGKLRKRWAAQGCWPRDRAERQGGAAKQMPFAAVAHWEASAGLMVLGQQYISVCRPVQLKAPSL